MYIFISIMINVKHTN